MKIKKLYWFFAFCAIIIAFGICTIIRFYSFPLFESRKSAKPAGGSVPLYESLSETGRLDLSDVDFASGRTVPLKGEWFYWPGELLSPEQVEAKLSAAAARKTGAAQSAAPQNAPQVMPMPAVWSRHRAFSQNPAFVNCGTMAVEVFLPYNNAQWGVRVPECYGACKLFANEALLAQSGTVAASAGANVSQKGVRTAGFFTSESRVLLVLQIANFEQPQTGTRQAPTFGLYESVERQHSARTISEALVCGAFLALCVHYICLFALRKKDKSLLIFALLCLAMCAEAALTGEQVFSGFFAPTRLGWRINLALANLSGAAIAPLLLCFLRMNFPQEVGKKPLFAAVALAAVWGAAQTALPPMLCGRFSAFYEAFAALLCLFAIVAELLAVKARKDGAAIVFAGTLLLVLAAANDVLVQKGIINGFCAIHLGMLAFALLQSFFQARKFNNLHGALKEYAQQLLGANESLGRFVPRQTLDFIKGGGAESAQLGDCACAEMAAMFVNIRDFTSRCARMKHNDAVGFINELLAYLGPAVLANNGFVENYRGGSFLALFPRGADDALRAANAVREELLKFNNRLAEVCSDEKPVRVGIGINCGAVVLGAIGEAHRIQTAAFSEAVGVAVRLEQLTKTLGGPVLVSAQAIQSLENHESFVLTPAGREYLKGKSEPIAIYRLGAQD